MKLTTVHQVLIISAMALGVIVSVRSVYVFAVGGKVVELALGVGAGVFAVVLGLYLRKFRMKLPPS